MANKSDIRKTLVSFTPPICYPILRKIINSSFLYRLNKAIGVNFYSPTWNTITKGPFKGIELYFDSSKGMWEKEMVNGRYDQYFVDYLLKIGLKGKIFFDVGAHIGYSTLTFAKLVGEKGKVVAFEPNTFNLERLSMNVEKNVKLSPIISIEQVAVANKNGKQKFLFTNNIDDWTSSGSFLSESHPLLVKSSYESEFGFQQTTVKTVSLDSYVAAKGIIPDFIKIDVEGAEFLVFEGAKQLFKESRPTIFAEIHSIFNGIKVIQFLEEQGYATTILKEEWDGRCFIVSNPRKRNLK